MAKKQVYKINRFDGGLNNALHPSKIKDNELAELLDIGIKAGSLGPSPYFTKHHIHDLDENDVDLFEMIGRVKPGSGLYFFKNDYEMLDPTSFHSDIGATFLEEPELVEGGVGYWVAAKRGSIWIYDTHNQVWSQNLLADPSLNHDGESTDWWELDEAAHGKIKPAYVFSYINEVLTASDGEFKRDHLDETTGKAWHYQGRVYKRPSQIFNVISSPHANVPLMGDAEFDDDEEDMVVVNFYIANRDPETGQLMSYESDPSGIGMSDQTTEGDDWWQPGVDAVESCTEFVGQLFDKPSEGWGAAGGGFSFANNGVQVLDDGDIYGGNYAIEAFCNNSWSVGMNCYRGWSSEHDHGTGHFEILTHALTPVVGRPKEPYNKDMYSQPNGAQLEPYLDANNNVRWDFHFRTVRATNYVGEGSTSPWNLEDPSDELQSKGGVWSSYFGGDQYMQMFGGRGATSDNPSCVNPGGGLSAFLDGGLGGPEGYIPQEFGHYNIHDSHDIDDNWSELGFFASQGGWNLPDQQGWEHVGANMWTGEEDGGELPINQYEGEGRRFGWGIGLGKYLYWPLDLTATGQGDSGDEGIEQNDGAELGMSQMCVRGHWHADDSDNTPFGGGVSNHWCDGQWGEGGAEAGQSHQWDIWTRHGQTTGIPVLNGLNDVSFHGVTEIPDNIYDNNLLNEGTGYATRRESCIYYDFRHGQGDSLPTSTPNAGEQLLFRIEFKAIMHQLDWTTTDYQSGSNAQNGVQPTNAFFKGHHGTSNHFYQGYDWWQPGESAGRDMADFKIALWERIPEDERPDDGRCYRIICAFVPCGGWDYDLMTMKCALPSFPGSDEYECSNGPLGDHEWADGVIDIDFGDPDQNPFSTGMSEVNIFPNDVDLLSIHVGGGVIIDNPFWRKQRLSNHTYPPYNDYKIPKGGMGPMVAIGYCNLQNADTQNFYSGENWILDPHMQALPADIDNEWTAGGSGLTWEWGMSWTFIQEMGQYTTPPDGQWGLVGLGAFSEDAFITCEPIGEFMHDVDAGAFHIWGYARGCQPWIRVEFSHSTSGAEYYYNFEPHVPGNNWWYAEPTLFQFWGSIANPMDYDTVKIYAWDEQYDAEIGATMDDNAHARIMCISGFDYTGTSWQGMGTPYDTRTPYLTSGWGETSEMVPTPLISEDWVTVGFDGSLTNFITGWYTGEDSTAMQGGQLFFMPEFTPSPFDRGGWGLATFEGYNTVEELEESTVGTEFETDVTIVFGCTSVDWAGVENEPVPMYTKTLEGNELYELQLYTFFAPFALGSQDNPTTDDTLLIPQTLKEVNLYYQVQDKGGEWYKLATVNVEKGIRYENDTGREFIPFSQIDNTQSVFSTHNSITACKTVFKGETPQTFKQSSGYDIGSNLNIRYKAICTLGRHSYIGNIAELDPETKKITTRYTSRIIKSPSNRLHTFASTRFLDIGMNDGDEILNLIPYKNKILVFKRRKMYVIGTSTGNERLEATYRGFGIPGKEAVIKTSKGVVWVNNSGVFIYDEKNTVKKISHLKLDPYILQIVNNPESIMSQDTFSNDPLTGNQWASDMEDVAPILGYNQTLEQVYIQTSARAKERYQEQVNTDVDINIGDGSPPLVLIPRNIILDLETMAFSTGTPAGGWKGVANGTLNALDDYEIDRYRQITNVVNDDDGVSYALVSTIDTQSNDDFELATAHSVELCKWDPYMRNSGGRFSIQTKGINFGSPNIRKNLYKVYLSYSGMRSRVHLRYRIDNQVRDSQQYGYGDSESFQNFFREDGTIWEAQIGTRDIIDTAYFLEDKKSLRNIYAVQIEIMSADNDVAVTTDATMKINDISIVFKAKPVK